jgi:glycosyltransferase involved in cell wall biosynthesis
MRVLAFTRYDAEAASTRQRLLQYLPILAGAGIQVDVRPLLRADYVRSIAGGPPVPRSTIVRWYAQRMAQLREAADYDLIWIYVELFPWLPVAVDWLIYRAGKPVIFDFDDAFFVQYDESSRPLVRGALGGKHATLLKQAAAAVCGNEYLRRFAEPHCPRSLVIPTVVDTNRYVPAPARIDGSPVIGWIGSPSNWDNVRPLLPLLRELVTTRGVRVRVVGAGAVPPGDRFDGLELVPWSEQTEIEEVQRFDIGIMPLRDLPFQRGKSGYKLVQYMACALPLVASPVGVNSEIVTQGETGFLATDEQQWRTALTRLIDDRDLRSRLGQAGRRRAEESYSLASQAPRLASLFREVASSR